MPVIKQLCIYPIKAFHGISVDAAELTVRGLKFDRNWMLTDETGHFLTQRELPGLAAFQVYFSGDDLILESPSGKTLPIPLNAAGKTEITVNIWGNRFSAFDEGGDISAWLTDTIGNYKGRNLKMVRFNDTYQRKVDPAYLKGEDSHTAFADGFPYLVTSESSLSRLNERLTESGYRPVPMNRFRPNIVVGGFEAFRENSIDELEAVNGSYRLGLRKPCKRCKVTTVDQNSGTIAEPKEPLRTLTRMQTVPGLHGAYFGQNATLLSAEGAKIGVGDVLEVKQ